MASDFARDISHPLDGVRVLVAEDDVTVAMLLEDLLADAGCRVVGPVQRVPAALASATTEALDLAVLDVNLGGEPVYAVAEILAQRGIPFVFSTGYGAGGLDPRFRDRPVLAKPFGQTELIGTVKAVLGRSG